MSLLVCGLILPIVDLFVGQPVVFNPRWQQIPDGLWNLLGLGVGGYVGGRSLEKIAVALKRKDSRHPAQVSDRASSWHRRNNLKTT